MEIIELKKMLILLISKEFSDLFENLNQRAFSKGIIHTGMITNRGIFFGEVSLPFSLFF
jgi:hypothetical protein